MSSQEKTVLLPEPEHVAIGTQLSGTYRLDRHIATGGMGEVFFGHNIHNGDPVAIKIVLPEFARDPTILALFRKEGLVLKRLAHDAIVRYEIFTVDPGIGRPYIAMEFVDGISLAEMIEKGPMPLDAVRSLLARLASGLAAAHDLGVIHRDLSPDNVILPGGDVARAKIIDFGIARAASIGDATLVGSQFAGKYAFVSPEQLGMAGGEVTARSDIYSLGLLIAACLLGRTLDLGGSQADVIDKRLAVPDLAGIDGRIRPLLEDMLRPDPAARPAGMSEVVRRLGAKAEAAPVPVDASKQDEPPKPADATIILAKPFAANNPPMPDPAPPALETQPRDPPPAPVEPTWISATRSARSAGSSLAPAGNAPPSPAPAPGWATGSPVSALPPQPPSAVPAASAATEEEDVPWRIAGLAPRPAAPPAPPQGQMPPLAGSPAVARSSRRAAPIAFAACVFCLLVAGGGLYWSGLFDGGLTMPAPSQEEAATQNAPSESKPASEPAKPQQEAATQQSTEKALQAVSSAADRVAWLEAYRRDPCFYVTASSVSGADMSMQGLGRSEAPFHKLFADYAARFGSEGDMTVQLIRPNQCAVTDFLSALHGSSTRPPKLSLERFKLSNRQPLVGEIEPGEGRWTYLLLVDDDGVVHDATSFIDPQAERSSFTIPVNLKPGTDASAGGVPALLIAVTAPVRIGVVDGGGGKAASELLPAILGEIEAAKASVSATSRYFVIDG